MMNPSSLQDPGGAWNIRNLALYFTFVDPRISLMLLTRPSLPKDFQMEFTFSKGTFAEWAESPLITKSRCDFLVLEHEYTWRRPLFLDDIDFRYTEEAAALQIPYMSIDMKIDGCPEISITDKVEPLELFARAATQQGSCCKCRPYMLFDTDTLRGRMRLDKNFAEATESQPMTIYIVAHGLLLSCFEFDGITVDMACEMLKKDHDIHVNKLLLNDKVLDFSIDDDSVKKKRVAPRKPSIKVEDDDSED